MTNSSRWLNVFGSFNYLGFNIKLDCTEDVFNDSNSEALTTFTHEYIHYLQAVMTPYGIQRTITFIHSMLNVFRVIHEETNVATPLGSNPSENMKKALAHFENHIKNFCLGTECLPIKNPLEEHRLFTKDYIDILNAENRTIYHIPNMSGKVWVPLSQVSLEETMATIGMLTFEGKNSNDIYHELTSLNIAEEYKAIFIYFFEKFPDILNHAEFVFKFCDLCLMWRDPNQNVGHVFKAVVEKLLISSAVDCASFFPELILAQGYDRALAVELEEVKRNLEKISVLLQHLAEYNDIGKHGLDLTKVMKNGLFARINAKSIWDNHFGENWRIKSVHDFGCPLIHLEDGDPFTFMTSHEGISGSIDYIFAVAEIFNTVIYSEIQKCPFYYTGLCISSIKDSSICLSNPLQIPEDANGASCIFRNTMMIMGLHNKLWVSRTSYSNSPKIISRKVAEKLALDLGETSPERLACESSYRITR